MRGRGGGGESCHTYLQLPDAASSYFQIFTDESQLAVTRRSSTRSHCETASSCQRQQARHAVLDTAEKLYESVNGGPHRPASSGPGANDSEMVVLCDLAQAYPELTVTYTVFECLPI